MPDLGGLAKRVAARKRQAAWRAANKEKAAAAKERLARKRRLERGEPTAEDAMAQAEEELGPDWCAPTGRTWPFIIYFC